jgi:predicted enzyme involved in methoxymalonyl-ACP biosynthesis
VAPINRGRVSDPAQAALSGSQEKPPALPGVISLKHPDWRIYCLRAEDRLGDSGIVGMAMTHRVDAVVEIDNFMLSCRVIGRTIEQALLAYLAQEAWLDSVSKLRGWFVPTRKNMPARDFYACAGFTEIDRSDDAVLWEFNLQTGRICCPEWIKCDMLGQHCHAE